jgi:hypothetical protein
MKMLSLSRPWGWAIFDLKDGPKTVENRVWAPPIEMIGKRIALQAAKSWDDDALRFFLRLGLDGFPNRKENYPSGVILGVATIDRVVTTERTLTPVQARFFFGPYGWVLSDVLKLDTPIPSKGAQGLRELPSDVNALVLAALVKQWPDRRF